LDNGGDTAVLQRF